MRILAFDQSTRVSGWCAMENSEYKDSGVVDLHKIENTDERSKQMGIELCAKIAEIKPDVVVIENVQNQSNTDTVIKLARLQGMILGFSAANKIETHILEPSRWRKALNYRQGRGVSRKELKEQSLNYIKNNLGFEFSEDRAEACCIALAAYKIYDFDNDWI